MNFLKPYILAAILGTALSGCAQAEYPRGIALSFDTDKTAPAMVISLAINGQVLGSHLPFSGSAINGDDSEVPRGIRTHLLDMPAPLSTDPDAITIKSTWVDMITNKGWSAETKVLLSEVSVYRDTHYRAEITPVFGANGEMYIASDSVDRSGNREARTVGKVCGKRQPELDEDFRSRAKGDQRFARIYGTVRPAVSPDSYCPSPAD